MLRGVSVAYQEVENNNLWAILLLTSDVKKFVVIEVTFSQQLEEILAFAATFIQKDKKWQTVNVDYVVDLGCHAIMHKNAVEDQTHTLLVLLGISTLRNRFSFFALF